jgi:hypothetical protein
LRSALDVAILLLAVTLIWVDAIVTKRGLDKGLSERNPILRSFMKKFGLGGLMATRILASALLLLPYALLGQWGWFLFSIPFIWIMSCVILINIKRTG